jgi:hypothetical protein
MTRTGKIARLPRTVRDELNRRLDDGQPGVELVAWLNALPEVQAVLKAESFGRPVTEQNLSEWKGGGFRDWQRQQEALALARELAEDADELKGVAGTAVLDRVTPVLAAWLLDAVKTLLDAREAGGTIDLKTLNELCAHIVALRRGDHEAARIGAMKAIH